MASARARLPSGDYRACGGLMPVPDGPSARGQRLGLAVGLSGAGSPAGRSEITDRRARFTDSDVSKTAATSGSRATATTVPRVSAANRLGRLRV